MINLTNIVIQYKQTKDKQILNQIYKELKSTIQQKSRFIFYAKFYPLNLYHPCKYCRNCNKLNDIPKAEHNIICKDCDVCKCIKGFFNLKKDALCDYEDVENDLWLEILRSIENFDITKDFNTYLFADLWEWIPSFITKDFVKSLSNKSLTQKDEEGNEIQIDITDDQEEPQKKPTLQDILKVCQTDIEKKVCELYLNNPNLSQEEIAKELGTYKMNISRIINKLRKRLKKFVTK
jgi:RNA polymerase sigma factor (sigma-70 family)